MQKKNSTKKRKLTAGEKRRAWAKTELKRMRETAVKSDNTAQKPQLTKRETAYLKRRGDEFGRDLHEFASQAYDSALDYYSKHYNDPMALAAFNYDAGLEKSEAGLATHILAILDHPKTPNALFDAVADWNVNATNIKNPTGDSLLSCWSRDPKTIEACIKWGIEFDDNKAMAEELAAITKAHLGLAGGAQ